MHFNEAQKAVLTDYDEGKYAHLISNDPRSFSVTSIKDPALHLLLANAQDPIAPAVRPCELVSSIVVLDALKLELNSRNQKEESHEPESKHIT